MRIRVCRLLLPGLLVLTLLAAYGGWATITVQDLPDHGVARQPLSLTFTVRQHGVTPLSRLEPRVEAEGGGITNAAMAQPGSEPGQYTAQLVVPQAGDWRITIHSGFMASQVTLLPLPVVEPGATPPPVPAAATRGNALFVAKGCVTCHLHRDVDGSGVVAVGPELTGRRWPAEYLVRFLKDPSIGPQYGNSRMPNLDLKDTEIAALIAFLNGEPRASR
jgi:mono/diheme cytochrome c family protein